MIAERLERLRESNRKTNNDNDDNDDDNYPLPSAPPSFLPPLYFLPLLSIDDEDSDIENDFNPTQNFLLGDTLQQEKIAVGEKTSAGVKKVRFSENLNKLFPKTDEIFNDQRIDVDDDDDLLKHEIIIKKDNSDIV